MLLELSNISFISVVIETVLLCLTICLINYCKRIFYFLFHLRYHYKLINSTAFIRRTNFLNAMLYIILIIVISYALSKWIESSSNIIQFLLLSLFLSKNSRCLRIDRLYKKFKKRIKFKIFYATDLEINLKKSKQITINRLMVFHIFESIGFIGKLFYFLIRGWIGLIIYQLLLIYLIIVMDSIKWKILEKILLIPSYLLVYLTFISVFLGASGLLEVARKGSASIFYWSSHVELHRLKKNYAKKYPDILFLSTYIFFSALLNVNFYFSSRNKKFILNIVKDDSQTTVRSFLNLRIASLMGKMTGLFIMNYFLYKGWYLWL